VELHNLYSSPDNIRVIESRRMSWVGGGMEKNRELRNIYRILGKKLGPFSHKQAEVL
jgi:hypothetical protein